VKQLFAIQLIFQCVREKLANGFWVERPEGDESVFDKNKKTFIPGKLENEGIQRFPSAHAEQAGLILLLTEKLGMFATVTDCRYTTRTSATKPVS
jgi:hypothetical protein